MGGHPYDRMYDFRSRRFNVVHFALKGRHKIPLHYRRDFISTKAIERRRAVRIWFKGLILETENQMAASVICECRNVPRYVGPYHVVFKVDPVLDFNF